jgi:hypothetical protein
MFLSTTPCKFYTNSKVDMQCSELSKCKYMIFPKDKNFVVVFVFLSQIIRNGKGSFFLFFCFLAFLVISHNDPQRSFRLLVTFYGWKYLGKKKACVTEI